MSVKMYYDADADTELLREKKIAVIGYGNQGHAQAQNLRENGYSVIVSELFGTANYNRAIQDGFKPLKAADAAKQADIVHILLPDGIQPAVYRTEIAAEMKAGKALVFSHGFNIHYRQILAPPDIDVYMVAPKGVGKQVRAQFIAGRGVPGLIAVYQDISGSAGKLALAHACAIGCGRLGIIETSFAAETEADLFGEQAVLCGGLSELVRAGFDTLVEAGFQPEIAYFECLHEVKLIADLIYERGIAGMRNAISDTAEYGDLTRGRRIIGLGVREEMKKVLTEIRKGNFAAEWIKENEKGRPLYKAIKEKDEAHLIEKIGADLRQKMGFET
ncbi:MAG: ketol-acid reductoisomerase [Candidatus Neomarinimicrobiota bacterium]|nr:ketol-acid reductoisomerase [Candidatus Neomarinimicrobiota bacterium]MDD3965518.1 ketol-acid reductoisomerase [Candidatus Neomarinimicrobiota bacterium]MDX9780585.1 ketol-acid reductoisomerase [bacterium]